MRISDIIYESFNLPLRRYKLFILALILAIIFEYVNHIVYSIPWGDWSLFIVLIYTIFAFFIFGLILNLSNTAILEEKFEIDFKEPVKEAVREYFITSYYLLITFLISSLSAFNLNFYNDVIKIRYLLLNHQWGDAILSLHELVHQLPISMQINLQQNMHLNVSIFLIFLIFLSSLGFIGKIVAIKSDSFVKAFDLRVIFSIIKKIGYLRYTKFICLISLITIILVNSILIVKKFFIAIFVPAFLEVFVLFFIVNAFYLIIDDAMNNS